MLLQPRYVCRRCAFGWALRIGAVMYTSKHSCSFPVDYNFHENAPRKGLWVGISAALLPRCREPWCGILFNKTVSNVRIIIYELFSNKCPTPRISCSPIVYWFVFICTHCMIIWSITIGYCRNVGSLSTTRHVISIGIRSILDSVDVVPGLGKVYDDASIKESITDTTRDTDIGETPEDGPGTIDGC